MISLDAARFEARDIDAPGTTHELISKYEAKVRSTLGCIVFVLRWAFALYDQKVGQPLSSILLAKSTKEEQLPVSRAWPFGVVDPLLLGAFLLAIYLQEHL